MQSIMNFTFEPKPILTILNDINNKGRQGGLNLQPSYQRDFVWSDKLKDKLLYSLIRQFPIGSVVFRTLDNGTREVLDGQQRLTTIYNFVNNQYVVQGDYARLIIQTVIQLMEDNPEDPKLLNLKKKLNNKTKLKLKYDELTDAIKNHILEYNIAATNIIHASNKETQEYFMFVQTQEKLRAGELINSFSSSLLKDYLNSIDDLPLFLKKVGFKSNKRHEFDKHFYNIIGLLAHEINYGVSDKQIMKFALNASKPLNNQQIIDNMIININHITNNNEIKINAVKHGNIRSTKYLLLLLAFNMLDLDNNLSDELNNLSIINSKLAAFNSNKSDEVQRVFKNYSKPVIKDFKDIILVSKGSHSYQFVKNSMEKLSYYIKNFDGSKTLNFAASK